MTRIALFGFEQRAEFVVILVHHEHLHRAFQIFERHHRIRLAGFFGNAVLHRRDQAADARQAAVRQFRQLRGVRQRVFFQNRRERRQRMAGDVKTEQFLFVREQFVLRPFGQIADGFRHRRRFFLQRAEERALAFLFVGQGCSRRAPACVRFARTASRASGRKQSHAPVLMSASRVFRFTVRPSTRSHKSASELNFPPSFRAFKNRFDRHFAHALDGGEAEANGLAVARRREINPAFVHVRPQDLDAELARLGDVLRSTLPCPPCRSSSSRRKIPPDNSPSDTRSDTRRWHRRRRAIC